MEHKLEEIFQKAKYENTSGLAQNIWKTVLARDRRATLTKLWVFAATGITSLVGIVISLKTLLHDLSQSGFYEYFSLIFSDGRSILSYWKEFSLSLGESLPVFSTIIAFSLVFIFFLSLRYFMKQVGRGELNLVSS